MKAVLLAGILAVVLGAEAPDSIGAASMAQDGTITLRLRAEGPGGKIGEGQMTYRRGEPHYDEILRHLGSLKPGQTKLVPPWTD